MLRSDCFCKFSDGAARLEVLLLSAESHLKKTSFKQFVGDTQKALAELKEMHKIHVTEYLAQYCRAMHTFATKQAVLNPINGDPPLQTSAYRVGDITKARNPPKRVSKKQELANKKKRLAKKALESAPKKIKKE